MDRTKNISFFFFFEVNVLENMFLNSNNLLDHLLTLRFYEIKVFIKILTKNTSQYKIILQETIVLFKVLSTES